MLPSLWAVALLTAPSPMSPPPKPPVEAKVLASDTVLVKSSYQIKSVFLDDLYERYSFFVDYSPGGRKARILIRTRKTPLRIVVETGITDTGMRKRHEIVIKNPAVK